MTEHVCPESRTENGTSVPVPVFSKTKSGEFLRFLSSIAFIPPFADGNTPLPYTLMYPLFHRKYNLTRTRIITKEMTIAGAWFFNALCPV